MYCFWKEAVNTEDSSLVECYAVYDACPESIQPFLNISGTGHVALT